MSAMRTISFDDTVQKANFATIYAKPMGQQQVDRFITCASQGT